MDEEPKKVPLDLSFKGLLAMAEASAKNPFFEVYLANGFLNLNVRKIPDRLRNLNPNVPTTDEPEQRDTLVAHGEDYVCYKRRDGADAAFNLLGVSRGKACEQILACEQGSLEEKLLPELREWLLNIENFKYLKHVGCIDQDLEFENFKNEIDASSWIDERFIPYLKAYLSFSIVEQRHNNGWPSLVILKLLSEINKYELQIWDKLPNGKLNRVYVQEVKSDEKNKEEDDHSEDLPKTLRVPRINVMYVKDYEFVQVEFLNLYWKIHVSLAHTGENIQRAWGLLIDLALLYGVRSCKVLVSSQGFPAYQWGKEITLYCPPERVSWEKLLTEITLRFVHAGIEPNYLAFNDDAVFGSSFFSKRNDEDVSGRYVSSLEANNFNPSNQVIPVGLDRIRINCVQPVLKNRDKYVFEFYQKLLKKIGEASDRFLNIIIESFPECIKVNSDFPIWRVDALYVRGIFLGFDEKTKAALIQQARKLREVYDLVLQDFGKCTREELSEKEKEYSAVLLQVIEFSTETIGAKKIEEEEEKKALLWQTPPKGSPRDEEPGSGNAPDL